MMDVTAMLNTSSEATEQRRLEEPLMTPFRNRKPWDAGGYSLPFHTHQLDSFTDDEFSHESLMDIDQPRHKLSDSHSSFSSFASSNSISHSHSRPSSMSTVSSFHLPNHTVPEAIFTDSEISSHSSKTATESCSPVSPRSGISNSQSPLSPAPHGSCPSLVAERHIHKSLRRDSTDPIFTATEMANLRSTTGSDGGKEERPPTNSPRPASPSDAILIKRTAPLTMPCLPQPPSVVGRKYSTSYPPALAKDDTVRFHDPQPGQFSIQTRGHKRAASAPDIPGGVTESPQNRCRPTTSSNQITELTPPPSQHPNRMSPTVSSLYMAAPSTPPKEFSPDKDMKPCCMYIADCDTGSQLRKAVSHIFGRNKMCTRRIPTHIWVWYCRKHYQRARYRNAKEWARTLQYDLVSRQIKRLQEWSEKNLRSGEGGVVKDYRLAVRKREQRRLDAQKPKGEREFSDSEDDETSESQGETISNTAVPKWLLDLSGRTHDAAKIMEIIDGIQVDLANGALSAWPDIEILPNIVLNQDELESINYTKRRSSSGTHGRSQSLGSALKNYEYPSGPWMNQPRISATNSQSLPGCISQKRKRSFDKGDADAHSTQQSQRVRVCEEHVASVRQGLQSIPRPVFQKFSEQQVAEDNLSSTGIRGEYHPIATSAQMAPLVAPRPQECSPLSMAIHAEPSSSLPEGSYSLMRRGMHKRSYSDVGGLYSFQSPYRIPTRHRQQSAGSLYCDKSAPRRLFSPPAICPSFHQTEYPEQRHPAHIYQSTSLVPISVQTRDISRSGCYTLPSILSPLPSPGHDVIESVKALDLYSARR